MLKLQRDPLQTTSCKFLSGISFYERRKGISSESNALECSKQQNATLLEPLLPRTSTGPRLRACPSLGTVVSRRDTQSSPEPEGKRCLRAPLFLPPDKHPVSPTSTHPYCPLPPPFFSHPKRLFSHPNLLFPPHLSNSFSSPDPSALSQSPSSSPLPNALCLLLNPSPSPSPLPLLSPKFTLPLAKPPLSSLNSPLPSSSQSLPASSQSPSFFPLPTPHFLFPFLSSSSQAPSSRPHRTARWCLTEVGEQEEEKEEGPPPLQSPRARRAARGSSGRCARAGAVQEGEEGAEPGWKRPGQGKEKARVKGQNGERAGGGRKVLGSVW